MTETGSILLALSTPSGEYVLRGNSGLAIVFLLIAFFLFALFITILLSFKPFSR